MAPRTRALLLLSAALACSAQADPTRYRGAYTLGHEVNVFCPEINSQCYWLSGDTSATARGTLASIANVAAAEPGYQPYDPVCVVLAGSIDRASARSGFAADYDGLITVSQVFGLCSETTVVTEGDLQHHRWTLERIHRNIDGEAPAIGERPPDLEFGEGMHLSGFAGCNEFTGRGELHDDVLRVDYLALTMMACEASANTLERVVVEVLSGGPTIALEADRSLVLQLDGVMLRFRLRDWVK